MTTEPETRRRKGKEALDEKADLDEKETSTGKEEKDKDDEVKGKPVESKFGPMPTFPKQRVFARIVTILGVIIIVYFSSGKGKESAFAKQSDTLSRRSQNVDCSDDYKVEMEKFAGCVPEKCGRVVSDRLVTPQEAISLQMIAQKGLALGGSNGGASILDLHSGSLSKGEKFVNFYALEEGKNVFQKHDVDTYRMVKNKIRNAVAQQFNIVEDSLHLTHPTFFSRMDNKPPKTIHDEYWHPHVDKETYKSFHYTSLLYLSDYGIDFEGGKFVFTDADNVNRTVEPKKGRILIFTSGSENRHFVERVTSGTRYALTVAFTCDDSLAIADPSLK